MDVGGSFLELSCVRIAVLPAGSAIPDHRFEELTSHVTAFRELPASALPRRAAVPRTTGNATFSSMPTAFREALAEASSPAPLLRSRSASRDVGRHSARDKLPGLQEKGSQGQKVWQAPTSSFSATRLGDNSVSYHKTRKSPPVSPTNAADLDMTAPEVDSTFRLRYDVVHRDHAGTLIMKPFSEWDDFHSCKIWGVFGIVDCTQPGICDSPEKRRQAIFDAYDDFNSALSSFKDASVRRLIVFTPPDAAHENGSFIHNDPKSPKKENVSLHFSVGYVPERAKYEETRLEVRAQIIHFAGLLLHAIDRDVWKRRESPATDLVMSPIDEKYTADRQSKLYKRRPGRLDKLLGDGLLLMGSPNEALTKYNSAIEKAKANSDRLWLAGAMEGWSAAYVLTHVGSGRPVSDPILSEKLIEHYAEIYKLYQKKRVAEPESAAALRLAEFLGRWTNRRKDALDAAEHAATVGEGLRIQKRAALWEALARFSDRMGCRRKAALYLYRLGLLNASQSVWSSAVALMIASERQLCRNGRKPWASLNRRVLLTAATHAEEAGDSSTAARLYVEALVIGPQPRATGRDDDDDIVKGLNKAHVPSYLPAAKDVIHLGDISPLQIAGLSIREKEQISGNRSSETHSTDGPFIYNPFEAKKRAKAAAVARRAVTWVCGEPAQVSVRLVSTVGSELIVDVIAVLFSPMNAEAGRQLTESVVCSAQVNQEGAAMDDENASSRHTKLVRQALHSSSQIAKTVQETLKLHSLKRKSGTVRQLTVIPKRTGALNVQGLLLRLFNGALVLLEAPESGNEETSRVNVISHLPRISLSSHSVGGGTMEGISSRSPLTVYHGERRRFRVDIENTGSQAIAWMKAKVSSSHPLVLEITKHDFDDETILGNVKQQGASKSFAVEVLGKQRNDLLHQESSTGQLSRTSRLSSVSIVVEYEGEESVGIIRESGTYVKVSCKPAITLGRMDVFEMFGNSDVQCGENSLYGIALEIRNNVTAPATVQLQSRLEQNSKCRPSLGLLSLSGGERLIENGASVRMVTHIPVAAFKSVPNSTDAEKISPRRTSSVETAYRILWKLPALGRQGYLEGSTDAMHAAVQRSQEASENCSSIHSYLACSRIRIGRAALTFKIDEQYSGTNRERDICTVMLGKFWSAEVEVRNRSDVALPSSAVLDIHLVQNNERGVAQELSRAFIAGGTKRVAVGSLSAKSGAFVHTIKIRMSSTGMFRLQACLYDGRIPSDQDETVRFKLSEDFRRGLRASNDLSNKEVSVASHSTAPEPLPTQEAHSASAITQLQGDAGNPKTENGKTDSNSNDMVIEPAQTPTTPTLKRVGIKKKKKHETIPGPVLNVTHPSTVDSYPSSNTREPCPPILACAEVSFTVTPSTPSNPALPVFPGNRKLPDSYTALHSHSENRRELTESINAESLYH